MANNKSKSSNSIFKVIVIVILCAAAVGVGGYLAYRAHVKKMVEAIEVETFYDGVSVNNVPLGGLTPDEAAEELNTNINSLISEKSVSLINGEQVYTIKYGDIGAEYDIEETLREAYDYGRVGTVKERYKIVSDLKTNPKDFEAKFTYDSEAVRERLLKIAEELNQEPVNSTMKRENGRFVITDEKSGYEMDVETTLTELTGLIDNMEEGSVEITGRETEPEVTRQDNEKATSLIGTYYTTFTGSETLGRNINLKVGCENINGTMLAPGETFSMNEALGPQTYANGYRNAAVIVNGKIEDGLAGGVCQVTTTLYNAVILSELNVVERSNHSLAVAYVPLGQDAAVAGDYKDLKFQNNTEYPIYIEAYLSGNKLVTNIYGYEEHSSGREIKFENVVDSIIPKPAEKITEDPEKPKDYREVTYHGKQGKKVSTYKVVYENGKEVSREFFSSSVYRATPDEVTVGTGENTEETKSPEENGAKEAIPPEGSADGTENEVNANESGTVFGG